MCGMGPLINRENKPWFFVCVEFFLYINDDDFI